MGSQSESGKVALCTPTLVFHSDPRLLVMAFGSICQNKAEVSWPCPMPMGAGAETHGV